MLTREKVRQATELLREYGVDCWLTFVRESELNGDPTLDYIYGSSVTWHSAFIITPGGRTWAIVGEGDRATAEGKGVYGQVRSFREGIRASLLEVLSEINPATLAVNWSRSSEICDGITHGMYLTLMDFLRELGYEDRVVSAERIVSSLRGRKSPAEIERMRRAIGETEDIFRSAAAFIRPGRTEAEIAAFMLEDVARRGLELAWDRRHCPAVFTGPDTAGMHFEPTDRPVEAGHVVNMDFGVRVEGYCADLQRSFYVRRVGDTDVPPAVRHGFETIVTAIELARQALKPGVQGVEVDRVARDHVTARGYESFAFGLGHQVGRFVHDGTALLGPAWEKYATKPFQPVEAGMVFTLEPRVTVPGHGTVTIEEMVVVGPAGAEFLSDPQTGPVVVGD